MMSAFVNIQLQAQFFNLYLFPSKVAYRSVTFLDLHIPEVVLIELTLLMMSIWLLETCTELD